jgi:hypothetical protein
LVYTAAELRRQRACRRLHRFLRLGHTRPGGRNVLIVGYRLVNDGIKVGRPELRPPIAVERATLREVLVGRQRCVDRRSVSRRLGRLRTLEIGPDHAGACQQRQCKRKDSGLFHFSRIAEWVLPG